MSKPFFITGLPRSRTAWLSIAATGQKSICFHEPTVSLSCFSELAMLWSDDRFEYVGVSDSSLVMQIGRILREIGPKTLIVERSIEDVSRSVDCYFAPTGGEWNADKFCIKARRELEKYRDHPLVAWVDYDDLSDVDTVSSVLNWLMPNAMFPKLSELMHMNVQVDRDWILERAQEPHTNWHMNTDWQSA